RNWSGKPGWSYFCIRVADTKILLAHATRVFGAGAPKMRPASSFGTSCPHPDLSWLRSFFFADQV
ncbi:MAG: hypothetical protein LBT33_10375, partial [Spirochaetia bacterium]|nr:hypothetical protein [Spirochaetia bacterium]